MAYLNRPLLAAAVLALATALTDCGRGPAADSGQNVQIVEVARAVPAGGNELVSATGALRRQRQIVLSFRSAGTIQTLAVDDGYPVTKGQVLATLDPTAIEARLEQAEASLAKAKRDMARAEKLITANAMSQSQFDDDKTALKNAQSAADSARFDLDGARIVSPANGAVLTRSAQTGEVVQPGQAVVSMADNASPLILRVALSDRDALRVRTGAPARVRIQGIDAETGGQVSHIGSQAGAQTGSVDIDITLRAQPGLRTGLVGTATLHLDGGPGENASALRIPAEAMLEASGERGHVLVFDRRAGVARRREVRFLRFDGDEALVEGLAEGTEVVTAGAGYVADGQRIGVLDAGRAP